MPTVSPSVEPSPSRPPPSVRLPAASSPDLGEPREWRLAERYLPDPSLQYSRVPFAGPTALRFVWLALLFALSIGAVITPLARLALERVVDWTALLAIPGALFCLELVGPLFVVWSDLRNRAHFWRHFRAVDLGVDRVVPQQGTSLRYEVHLLARHTVGLGGVHVRLVFWESWITRTKLRWLRLPRRTVEKQGHDLVRQEIGAFRIEKGQHAVIRGTIRMPMVRPTEHHRGKPKHVSYVNITTTLLRVETQLRRGNCPQLITFPWL